jgi:hypothetical protein
MLVVRLPLTNGATMAAIETIGKYQVHLLGREVSGDGKWAPYLKIEKFDDDAQDFKCIIEKRRVAGEDVFVSEEEAENVAREFANMFIETGKI